VGGERGEMGRVSDEAKMRGESLKCSPTGILFFFLYVEEINRRAYIVSSAGL